MGLGGTRWLAVLLAAAVAIPALVFAQENEPNYLTPPETVCWSCHQVPQKEFPKLTEFFAILPPALAGGVPNTPFPYIVQVQNVWGADLTFVRPTMDLTNAPSISFVSDLTPLAEVRDGVVTVDPTQINVPQSHDEVVPVPFGYSDGTIHLAPTDGSPATGPILRLKVWGGDVSGEPAVNVSAAGRGQPINHVLAGRQAFDGIGYGNWTVRVEVTLAPADPLNLTLPPTDNQFGYNLKVDATAATIVERVLALPSRDTVLPGQSRAFQYNLVATGEPAAGETVKLYVDGAVFYEHDRSTDPCCANVTRAFQPDIAVGAGGALSAEVGETNIVAVGVQNGATMATVSEVVGYAAAFLLISSVWTGGMFGKASRRQLNTVFGSAKRRVAFHNFLSYGIILAAAIHTVLFIVEAAFYWTVGLIWGGIAILSMFGLGLTGAFQVQMIRKWSYGVWRWSHYGMAVAAILFTVVHGLLDGVHFATVQETLGWEDPLDPRDVT